MKLKYAMIIGLLLMALLIIPFSFAADEIQDSASDADSALAVGDADFGEVSTSNLDTADGGSNDLNSNMEVESTEDSQIADSNGVSEGETSNLQSDDENIPYVDLDTSFANFNLSLSEDNTIYVNSSYTGSTETGTQINPYKSLSSTVINKLTSAKNNIFLADGVYTISSQMTISKAFNVNIIGESTDVVLKASNNAIFYITSKYLVSLYNLTLTDGYVSGYSAYGGLIEISNKSNLNIIGSILKNSRTVASTLYSGEAGGAIYNDGGTLKLFNCSVLNNSASVNYGNESYGGAIFNYKGDIYIFNSIFENNSAIGENSAGGAIYSYFGNLWVYKSFFISNSLNADYSLGGAICTWNNYETFIINSTFDGNTISGDYTFGSAVANNARVIEFINNTVVNNIALGTASTNTTVYNFVGELYYINNIEENNIISVEKDNLLLDLEEQITVDSPFSVEEVSDLPDSYDLRDYGLVTSVKDQMNVGSCWAFASLAALESFLLKYENISFDFSEQNLQDNMNYYGSNGTDFSEGGFHTMGVAYLVRWSGPVLESDDPYKNYVTYPKTNVPIQKHVQDVLYLPLRMNYTDNDQIKYALMKYGAMYVSICWDNSAISGKNVYSNVSAYSNHAITLVGWDDNYSASNFGTTPPGDGAWIIKNSWGTGSSVANGGYYYISYYDKTFAGFGADTVSTMAFTNVENVTNYKDIYQYDPIGNTFESLGYNCNTAWFKNRFTAISDNPLSAFGLYTFGNSSYLVQVYVNGVLKYTQKSTSSSQIIGAGYHTIKFKNFIELKKGDVFEIAVRLTTPASMFPIAVESANPGYSSYDASANTGESFISYDGINWVDIAKNTKMLKFYDVATNYTMTKTNVCLKAYTEYMSNLSLNVSSNVTFFSPGDMVEITLNLTNLGEVGEDINISSILGDGATLISYDASKGSFDTETGTWSINVLNESESTILKLNLLISTEKEIVSNLFNIAFSGYNLNDTSSVECVLYYSGFTHFEAFSDLKAFSLSNEILLFNLTDALSSPVAAQSVHFSLFDSENNQINSSDFITSDYGSIEYLLDLTEGNYSYILSFDGDDYYKACNFSGNIEISKRATSFVGDYLSQGISTLSKSMENITITLIDYDNQALMEKEFTVTNYNTGYITDLVTDLDGTDVFTLDLNKGNYLFILAYAGDDYYAPAFAQFSVNVSKRDAPFMILGSKEIESSQNYTVCLVDTEMKRLVNSSVIFKLMDSTGNIKEYVALTDENGVASISHLAEGNYKAFIFLQDDPRYEDISASADLSVSKSESFISIINSTLVDGANFVQAYNGHNISIALKDKYGQAIVNKTIRIAISGDENSTQVLESDEDGIVNIKLPIGEYLVDILMDADEFYTNSSYGASIEVVGSLINVEHTGDDARDIQNAIDSASPGDYINLGDNYNYTNLANINITKNLSILAGENVSLSSAEGASAIFDILPLSQGGPDKVAISNIDVIARDDDVIVSACADKGDYSSLIAAINITGIDVSGDANPNSVAILKIVTNCKEFVPSNPIRVSSNTFVSGMKPLLVVNNWTDDKGNVSIPASDKISTVLSIEDVKTKYGNVTAVLRDINSNILSNKAVSYSVDGVIYNTTTNDDGEILISGLKTDAGIIITFEGDDSYGASEAVLNYVSNASKQTFIKCSNMTTKAIKKARSGEYFLASLIDENGNAIAGKKVQIGFNGKIYERTTNETGGFKLQVNLAVAAGYTFAISFLGDEEYSASFEVAKITVTK